MADPTLTAATWFWLLVPMPLVVLASLVSFFRARRRHRSRRAGP